MEERLRVLLSRRFCIKHTALTLATDSTFALAVGAKEDFSIRLIVRVTARAVGFSSLESSTNSAPSIFSRGYGLQVVGENALRVPAEMIEN